MSKRSKTAAPKKWLRWKGSFQRAEAYVDGHHVVVSWEETAWFVEHTRPSGSVQTKRLVDRREAFKWAAKKCGIAVDSL